MGLIDRVAETSQPKWNVSSPRRIRISHIRHSHRPRRAGERRDKWGREPIDLRRTWLGYLVLDGNDRLYYAKERGDTHVWARIWQD